MKLYTLHFDGSCGPKNPGGTAAFGVVISDSTGELHRENGIIGTGPRMSNNLAEFVALEKGLSYYARNHLFGECCQLQVYGDSKLVIQVMNRFWLANRDKLYYPAYMDALAALAVIRKAGHRVTFDHIPREQNTLCDSLSKARQWQAVRAKDIPGRFVSV